MPWRPKKPALMQPGDSTYVLDASALLAFLGGEPGAPRVKQLLRGAGSGPGSIHMSLMNLGEVLHITERRRGWAAAQEVAALVCRLPVTVHPVTERLVLDAAHVKAQHPLSYADAFAVVTARHLGAALVTLDRELRQVEGSVKVEWLQR